MIRKTIQCTITAFTIAWLGASSHAAVTVGTFALTADQEVPASTSVVTGQGEFSFNDTNNRLTLLLQFVGAVDLDGLQTADVSDDLTGLHVHNAAAGANGGIVYNFLTDTGSLVDGKNNRVMSIWEADEGVGTTLEELLPDFRAGNLYVNAHTTEFPAGAIRGQLLFPETVPEPTTGLMMVGGLIGLLCRRERASV